MFRHWLFFASAVYLACYCSGNYCRDNNLCCPGRDSACVVQKAHQNAIIDDPLDKPCYCDHACMKLGDCCPDFRETCGVLDCVVSGWGEWSECDNECGSGSMMRSRRVVQAPARGGKHCPTLVQRRACQSHHGCTEESDIPLREESAMILPGSLSISRHSDESVDIRKNLRLRNPDDPESNSHREYCVQYEVTKVSKACHTDSDYKALREGATVCVMCETAALRRDLKWRCGGHGVSGHATRFYALVAPHCHGKWIRASNNADKNSGCCLKPDFIFV
ncbi:somatomedin-B and thrombospondin type-1 domain-containing protein-like [Danaus plexippus]|uniref:somatomedin-B and thrombospondin type-1 domain-containing protein-like n=1 Tax=Danaus plexippus TaxID=13037 RepID=UPI0013C456C7|nr:somatomedin-B and thrombospondin type-1 domain-containing protein-like [Danaus plexippus]